jgi:tRNA dimethylallyltransferase
MRERLLASLQNRSPRWLHRMLTRIDPESADRIHANDTPKLVRALEVCFSTGEPFSRALTSGPKAGRDPLTGFRLLRIGLNPPRAALYDRLNQRCAEMFATGLVDETRSLLARYGPIKALDSLGYRQAMQVLRGEATEPQAIAAAQQGHRNYAKRQLTWFRREPDVHWIERFGDEAETLCEASELVESQLNPSQPAI